MSSIRLSCHAINIAVVGILGFVLHLTSHEPTQHIIAACSLALLVLAASLEMILRAKF